MCNNWCIEFAGRAVPKLAGDLAVLEVGALDVNGSVRSALEPSASRYVGIDITEGPGVDEVLDVARATERFGTEAFDVVVTAEMLEHCRDWQGALVQMMQVLKPGGMLILTTRSPGFPLHEYPADHWRFTPGDLASVFSPVGEVVGLEDDLTLGWPGGVGIMVVRRANAAELEEWARQIADYRVYSVDQIVDDYDAEVVAHLDFETFTVAKACADRIRAAGATRRVLWVGRDPHQVLPRLLPGFDVTVREQVAGADRYDYIVVPDTLSWTHEQILEATELGSEGCLFVCPAAEPSRVTSQVASQRLTDVGFGVDVTLHGHGPWCDLLARLRQLASDLPELAAELAHYRTWLNYMLHPFAHEAPAAWKLVFGSRAGAEQPAPRPDTVALRVEASRRWQQLQGYLLAALGRGLDTMKDRHERQRADVADLPDRLQQLEATLARAHEEVQAVRASMSWRVTKPLRSTLDAFRGLWGRKSPSRH